MSLVLWPEQQRVYNFAISRTATAMFCEQRTGKTFVTLAIIRKLSGSAINLHTGEGNDFCGVIVSLLSNRDSTWLDNLNQHLPWLNVTSDWEEFKKLPNPRLLLVHFELLPNIINRLCKYKKINFMLVDEAQRIANRGNKASRACARMAWVHTKLVLTGTPQDKFETEYFGIFKFLDPEVFGNNWADFEERFMEWPEPRGMDRAKKVGGALLKKKLIEQRILKNKAKFREDMREEFINLIQPYCVRLTKQDAGIIEPVVHKVLVGMSPKQRRVYQEMVDHSFSHVDSSSRVLAQLKVTNIMKRRQIATGFVYDDDEELHWLGKRKLRKLVELFEEFPKPVVIFTAFRPENNLVTKALRKLGYDIAQVNGQVPRKKSDRAQIWRDFQKGQYDGAVVQIKTGGTGVDLWLSSHAIVFSMGHSYRDWDQALSRLDNKQKKAASEFFVLCTENTVDEDLFDLVIVKKFNAELTLKHLKGAIQWPRKQPPKPKRRRKARPTAFRNSSRKPAFSPRRSA